MRFPEASFIEGLDKLSISGDKCKVLLDIIWPSLLFISLTCSDGITHGKADAQWGVCYFDLLSLHFDANVYGFMKRSLWGAAD